MSSWNRPASQSAAARGGARRARFGTFAALGVSAIAALALAACSAVLGIPYVTAEGTGDPADASPSTGFDGSANAPGDASGTGPLADATSSVDAGDGAAVIERDSAADADAGAPCTSTVTDPLNCGRCGHSCLGGACVASACQPIALVPAQGHPFGIAVDDTSVYWTDRISAQVLKASKVPQAQPSGVVLAAGSTGGVIAPTVIAVDGPYVFWLSSAYDGGVRRCAKSGCGGVGALVAAANAPSGLALDEARAYFSDSSGTVSAVDKLADAGSVVEIAKNPGYARRLAVDSTDVYWTDHYNATGGKRVSRAPKSGLAAGLTPFVVATEQSSPYGIALAEGHVYWAANLSGGSIRRAPKTGIADGGVAEYLGPSQPNPINLVVTSTHVYSVNQGPDVSYVDNGVTYMKHPHGSVVACDLPACAGGVRVLATEQDEAWDIAADDTAVYWTASGKDTAGSIMKIAR